MDKKNENLHLECRQIKGHFVLKSLTKTKMNDAFLIYIFWGTANIFFLMLKWTQWNERRKKVSLRLFLDYMNLCFEILRKMIELLFRDWNLTEGSIELRLLSFFFRFVVFILAIRFMLSAFQQGCVVSLFTKKILFLWIHLCLCRYREYKLTSYYTAVS